MADVKIEVRELNHVAIHVRDLARSSRFYGEVLGLPVIPRPAFDFEGAWFGLGKQELHLILDAKLSPGDKGHHHFALRVDDPFAAKAYLESRGVPELKGPKRRPDGAMQLFLSDPDGYRLELFSAP
jgi:catechol 2,3-dioxygenase-like lactoylglutathione lyase family enzyme